MDRLRGWVIALSILFIAEVSAFFSEPRLCSVEELAQLQSERKLDMCWHFGRDSHFHFVSRSDEVYFEIRLGTLPVLYDDFVARNQHHLIADDGGLIFSYRTNEGSEEINRPQASLKSLSPDEFSYKVANRRIFEQASPRRLVPEELVDILRTEYVLFYTGAGISLASDVPAMSELFDLLELEKGERFLFSLERAIEHPREFASKIMTFHKACFFSPPTKAHYAIKELADFKMVGVITENLDCLHEASGIIPYRVDAMQLRDEVGSEFLKQFDRVICIGLSYDDRGFLGWYKQCNPQGTIISVDLQQPSYLGDEDFIVKGDLQELIPYMREAVKPSARI